MSSNHNGGALPSDQLAPYSQEAEEAVLGACLVDPLMFQLYGNMLKAEDFYILRHGYIWDALAAVMADGLTIDLVSVVDALRARNRLNDVGGPGYILHLVNSTPSSQHAETYAALVHRASVRRRLLTCADEMKALAMDEQISTDRVMADSERIFVKVRDSSIQKADEPIQDIADQFMAEIEERMLHPEKRVGILSGWKDFDELTSGFIPGHLIIWGGRPRMGKSAIMFNIALNLAKLRVRVGIFTMEMSRKEVILRLAAIESGLNIRLILDGKLTPDEFSKLRRAINVVRSLPIWIDDTAVMTPMLLDSIATRWKYTRGLDLLLVDYIQLMSGGNFKENERVAEIGFISRRLKNMARVLNIPILAGAQLNRNLENREDKHPQLSDLRESGAIENDADLVHLLYRDKVYHERTSTPNALEVFTAKHRNGAEGNTTLYFDAPSNKITGAIVKVTKLSDFGLDEKPKSTLPAFNRKNKYPAQTQTARTAPLDEDTRGQDDN